TFTRGKSLLVVEDPLLRRARAPAGAAVRNEKSLRGRRMGALGRRALRIHPHQRAPPEGSEKTISGGKRGATPPGAERRAIWLCEIKQQPELRERHRDDV